jgi:hypothetical protein
MNLHRYDVRTIFHILEVEFFIDSLAPFGYEVAHVGDGHPVFAWPEVTLTAHKRGHHYFGEIELSVGC